MTAVEGSEPTRVERVVVVTDDIARSNPSTAESPLKSRDVDVSTLSRVVR